MVAHRILVPFVRVRVFPRQHGFMNFDMKGRHREDVSFFTIKTHIPILFFSENAFTEMIDIHNRNAGYLCGRLFAYMEELQNTADPNIDFAGKYINKANVSPAEIFPELVEISASNVEKIADPVVKVNFEKMMREVMLYLPKKCFPNNLTLQDQCRFMVGYNHEKENPSGK